MGARVGYRDTQPKKDPHRLVMQQTLNKLRVLCLMGLKCTYHIGFLSQQNASLLESDWSSGSKKCIQGICRW